MLESFVYAAGETGISRARILAFNSGDIITIEFPDLTIQSVPINFTIFSGENITPVPPMEDLEIPKFG